MIQRLLAVLSFINGKSNLPFFLHWFYCDSVVFLHIELVLMCDFACAVFNVDVAACCGCFGSQCGFVYAFSSVVSAPDGLEVWLFLLVQQP